jgi:hypothetical protein
MRKPYLVRHIDVRSADTIVTVEEGHYQAADNAADDTLDEAMSGGGHMSEYVIVLIELAQDRDRWTVAPGALPIVLDFKGTPTSYDLTALGRFGVFDQGDVDEAVANHAE